MNRACHSVSHTHLDIHMDQHVKIQSLPGAPGAAECVPGTLAWAPAPQRQHLLFSWGHGHRVGWDSRSQPAACTLGKWHGFRYSKWSEGRPHTCTGASCTRRRPHAKCQGAGGDTRSRSGGPHGPSGPPASPSGKGQDSGISSAGPCLFLQGIWAVFLICKLSAFKCWQQFKNLNVQDNKINTAGSSLVV